MAFSQFFPLERHPETGEPYIPLPAPYDRIIVTPPRRDDVPRMVTIMNDAPVKKWLDGPPFPYLDVHAEDWITRTRDVSDRVMHELRVANEEYPRGPFTTVSGCPVACLRAIRADGEEDFLGAIEFTRCGYPDLLDREERERLVAKNESKNRGDPEIVWCIGCELSHRYILAHLRSAEIEVASNRLPVGGSPWTWIDDRCPATAVRGLGDSENGSATSKGRDSDWQCGQHPRAGEAGIRNYGHDTAAEGDKRWRGD